MKDFSGRRTGRAPGWAAVRQSRISQRLEHPREEPYCASCRLLKWNKVDIKEMSRSAKIFCQSAGS